MGRRLNEPLFERGPMRVADLMRTEPKSCTPEASLQDARDLMQKGKFRHLPVMEEDELVGVITDRDIRSFLLPSDIPENIKERMDLLKVRRVGDHMSTPVTSIHPESSI